MFEHVQLNMFKRTYVSDFGGHGPMQTDYLVPVYLVYAAVSVALTIWLARTLFTNGTVFLSDVFPNTPKLAEAVNRLLVVGFYLFNLGYACLLLKASPAQNPVA